MCGIVGIAALDLRTPIDASAIRFMADQLIHRGPDGYGQYSDGHLAFGFRRLSLVDLLGGAQPMFGPSRQSVLVCNGEIFNHNELRAELLADGYSFSSRCDVEVIVALYEKAGLRLFEQLNGQFAFALYDAKARRLILARDHFGVCPLYYSIAGGELVFASEIKAILAYRRQRPTINLTGLDQILALPGLVSPVTMFEGICSVPPGHFVELSNGSVRVQEYWDLDYPSIEETHCSGAEDELTNELQDMLSSSVRKRLQADVPVGLFLSGGLDSSLIAALAGSMGHSARHTFSIEFGDRSLDEGRFQRLMAEQLGSSHHPIAFDWTNVAASLQTMVRHAECPVKESYNTCSIALAAEARSVGVKAVLSGEGADELFAGYIGYRFDDAAVRTTVAPHAHSMLDDQLERQTRLDVWGDENLHYESSFSDLAETRLALYSAGLREAFREFDCFRRPLISRNKVRNRHVLHQRSYLDFKLRLADHLVTDHGDRMSMSQSVEVRYPFLDLGVVNLARRVPPGLKLKGMTEKYLLKKVASRFLPDAIVGRQKYGFNAPGSTILLRNASEWMGDHLSHERIRRQGFFDPDVIERVKERYLQPNFRLNVPFETDLLMVVLTFSLFLDEFCPP